VIEDGVNAVGLLAGPTQIPLLIQYLDHEDPIVRMKAADSLLVLDRKASEGPVSLLMMDKFPIVRDSIRARLASTSPGVQPRDDFASIRKALSRPKMERDQVQVRVASERDAKRILKMAETLLEQRSIQSRPRSIQRDTGTYLVFSEEAFTEIRRRFMEGVA
jgi:hypothetical protein